MSDYHSIGSDGRLGGFELQGVSNTFGNQGFEGLGEFGALTRTEQSRIQGPARSCPQLQSLSAQAINQINRGQFNTARSTAARIAAMGRNLALQPGLGFCGSAGSQIEAAIHRAAASEQQKSGGRGGAAATQQQDTGATAGEVLGGIGSILGAIAGPLSQIFISHQQTQLQLEQIKAGGLFPPQPQFVPGIQASAAAARRGSSTAIIAIVIGVIILGAFFMMRQKKD